MHLHIYIRVYIYISPHPPERIYKYPEALRSRIVVAVACCRCVEVIGASEEACLEDRHFPACAVTAKSFGDPRQGEPKAPQQNKLV